MENKLSLKEVIKNAKSSALRDGYDYFIIHDTDDTYSFSRDYGQLNNSDNSIIGKVITKWKGSLISVSVIYF